MVERKAYLVGSGIASLASAAYLLREGRFLGQDIIIFDEDMDVGGSLDGRGSSEKGYVLRGGRMLSFSTQCTYDLLSFIPSIKNPKKSVLDEIREFNEKLKSNFSVNSRGHSQCRLVKNGQKLNPNILGFSYKDRFDLLEIMMKSEDSLGSRRIEDCFEKSFFSTNFWYMWATLFAFQSWHSAIEFKRYLHRFIHEFSRLNLLAGVDRLPYNQYDSLVLPLVKWLKSKGVNFMMETEVTDFDFTQIGVQKSISKLHYRRGEDTNSIDIAPADFVFVTNGSVTASSSLGSMKTAPLLKSKKESAAWTLWETLAVNHPEFGIPAVFDNRVDESKWLSFTVTLKDPEFFKLMEQFTGESAGASGLITFADSNWLLTLMLAHQPYFINQPSGVNVFWGYGLFVDRPGNFVKRKMSECTGEEIMIELCSHLHFTLELPKILKSSNCIPCMMPFVSSPFLTREKKDRPQVVPPTYLNLAFVGQYCEIPDDVVFTVDYSVRAAQTAVYKFLALDKAPPPVYVSHRDFKALFDSLKTMFRADEKKPPEEHLGSP
ncbi:MAG TPA: oleate hydratase [Pseudobdellovibrionaceae bacterium]